ncbi:MAG: T9SS type A sorting domain-containing protein [Omnitrophica WOR_2 bacterium]
MNRALYLIAFLFFVSSSAFSQTWERLFGVPYFIDSFRSLNTSYDEGYIVLIDRYYYPDTRGVIVKTDVNGNLLYELILGTGTGLSQGNYPSYIESTADGGMIICGSHDNFSPNDVGITKLDVCGNLEWCKTFRTDDNPDWGRVVHQLSDGGFVMLTQGYTDAGYKKIHLFRFDDIGNLLWIQPYALTENNPLLYPYGMTDLIVTANNDFFMTGSGYWASDSITGRLKAMTIIADSSREEKVISIYERDNDNEYSDAYNSCQKGSGNIYVGACDVDQNYHPMLLCMDTLGNFLYDTLIEFPLYNNRWADGYIVDPLFTSDDRMFVFTVYLDSTLIFNSAPMGIHEIDSIGGWHNTFVLPTTHPYAKMVLTKDDKILFAGCFGYENDQQVILSKFNTSLQYDSIYTVPRVYDYLCPDAIVSKTISLDCEVIVDVKDIPTPGEYYKSIKLIPIIPTPNPASDEIRFMLKNTEHHRNIRITCYDIFGREIDSTPVNSGMDEANMDISSWSGGMYMAVVYAGNTRVGSAKFIVSK